MLTRAVIQSNAAPLIRGQTVSLFMLAMRGGMALGSLVTGVAVGTIGVRLAMVVNGALAVIIHLAVARQWSRAPGGLPAA